MSAAKAVGRGIGKTIKWFVILVFALIAVIIVVAIVALGKAGSDANKTSAKVTAHISQIKLGMTEKQVRGILGKPDTADRFTTNGLKDDTWDYGALSTKGTYIFDFENFKLTSKSRFGG